MSNRPGKPSLRYSNATPGRIHLFDEAFKRSWHCAVPEREHDQQVLRRDDRVAARHEAFR